MAKNDFILIENARANNLKNIGAKICFGRLTLLAGKSGSGKSSFAYNCLFMGENCKITGRLRKTIYVQQKTASTAKKWHDFLSQTKNLPPQSLIIVDELLTGMTGAEAVAAAKKLAGLAKAGHAVVAVEHRREAAAVADTTLVFGPESGADGGRIIAETTGKDYLRKIPKIKIDRAANKSRKQFAAAWREVDGMKNYSAAFGLGKISAIAGAMGCGKSTFLSAAFRACDKSSGAGERRGDIKSISGKDNIRRPHIIDASPISKNPRSNVATYYGISKFLASDALALTIDQIAAGTKNKLLLRRLEHLQSVGLGYLSAAQPSYTLSGGECQRLKLAKMMCKKLGDRSLYIFDNPVRGLDEASAVNIMLAFDKMVKNNNSVLIAENDPLALRLADEIIPLPRR